MLTANEIKKALECCQGNWDCANCPYNDKCSSMHKDALDYFNNLEAENERLKKELKITRAYLHDKGLEWDLLSYSERIGG